MRDYKIKDNDIILADKNKKYNILKVKDLPENEKPREKLLNNGPESLKIEELISIVLNTGTKKEEILSMSGRIIKEYGEKIIVSQKNPQIISNELKIPLIKSCQLVACFEIGKRLFKKEENNLVVRTPREAFAYLKDMGNMPKEIFRGLYLNSHYKIIHDEIISVGSLTASIIHPREVFKPALQYSAAAIIVAHNHPSQNSKPTLADIETTKKLKQASEILGIELLDHIIITKNGFSSIAI